MMKKLKQSLRSGSPGTKKEQDSEEERWFLENGSIFLKELIADCDGKSIPIRSFSSDQILEATYNFDYLCLVNDDGWGHKWYKGIFEDKSYLFKRFTYQDTEGEAYNDSVLAARMSNHSNFLKLFGCCFEFSSPVFVFEDAEHGALNERGGIMVNGEEFVLPWSVRLKIAKEIANAVTYLHTAFPKIIIHRNIKPSNIFVDRNWTARLTDFSVAVVLPEGKSKVEVTVMGTYEHCDPSYIVTGFVTEYTDVYSFGICLLVSLTGEPAYDYDRSGGDNKYIAVYVKGLYENGKLDEIIDPMMVKDITSAQRLQVEACVVLALRCCEASDQDRPKMIQVAKELKRIQTSLKDPST